MQGVDFNSNNTNAYGAGSTTGNGYSASGNFYAGNYEYVVANSALATNTAGTISITSTLVNSYYAAAATTAAGRRSFQVVRIPQYNNVTLGGQVNALAWDGDKGGILAMDVAGTLTLNGQVLNAAGLGFRGGGGKLYTGGTGLSNTDYRTSNAQAANGAKGEGIAGTPRYTLAMQTLTTATTATDNSTKVSAFGNPAVTNGYPNGDNGRGAPGNAGGGGTDDVPNAGNGSNSNGLNVGGAGGGNGGTGGLGGWPRTNGTSINTNNQAVSGATFAQATTSRLVMGGGGGAGSNNNGDGGGAQNGTGAYSSGAAGGGLILVRTGSVSGTGTANASGAAGILLDASGTGSNDGAGGGGAGGTVLFTANTAAGLANLTVLATGGVGGSNKDANDVAHGPGGGGGGGIIFTNGSINAASSVAGGAPGTTTTNDKYTGTAYGATQGSAGVMTTNSSTSIDNSIAGADCLIADVVTTLSTTQTSAVAGSSVTYTATVQNNGPGNSSGVAPQVQLPAGLTAAAFTSLPTGASYNNNTGVLTLPTTTSLAYGAANRLTYNFTFTAPNYTTTITGTASSTATTTDPTAANNNGSASNASVQTVITLPNNSCAGIAYPGAGGSGLSADYYNNYFAGDLTFFNTRTPGLTRTDGNINFPNNNSWGSISPPVTQGTSDNPDYFSARYRGSINIAAAGSYTFYLTSDDDSYLWLDTGTGNATASNATINNGGAHGATTKQTTITLTAGLHDILLYYGDQQGDNSLILQYSGGPNNLAQQVVPNSILCPTSTVDLATIINGPTAAAVGQTVVYQATTTNNGVASATSVVTTITLANKPAASTVTVTGGSYDATTGIVTFTNGALAAGASVVNTVSFVAQASPTTATGQAASTTNSADANTNNNNGSATNANVTTTVSPTGAAGTPAPCATAGKDGSPTVSVNPNAYYPSTASQTLAVGATSIAVGTATGTATNITAGDLLLVIQMQGADIDATNTDSYGDGMAGGGASGNLTTNFTAGTYEYVVATNTVTAASGGTINLASGLKNGYTNAAATATTGQRTFQVIRVPQYTNLTLGANLTATTWNGSSGGIIVLDVAGQLNMAGFTIDASGAGFRGGAGRKLTGIGGTAAGFATSDYRTSAASNVNGTKGEGTAGTPRYVNNNGVLLDTRSSTNGLPTTLNDGYPNGDNGRGAPGTAGGGGTDGEPIRNQYNSGGGGGANGGAGGRGGDSFRNALAVGGEPGTAFPAASTSRLVLGGGGGSGTTNDGTGNAAADGFASSGAAGGGIIIVRTGTITGTGTITANGASALNGTTTTTSVQQDGGGGGGAGGSILITAATPSGLSNLTLNALGGMGGRTNPNNAGNASGHGPGGGGGGGVILTNGAVAGSPTTAGTNGLTYANGSTTGVAFGAAAGLNGLSNTSVSPSIANSAAGANCVADVATVITAPTNPVAAGQTATLNVAFTNNGPLAAANVTRQVQLPAGLASVVIKDAAGNVITGAAYNATTGLVTYPAVASLASGDNSASSVITFTAPASGPVAAKSTIGTDTPEAITANNTSTFSLNVSPVADVTTTLAGPIALNAGQPSGTFTATYTNYGPSVASTVTQQVTIPAGATNVLVNGVAYTPTNNVIDFGTAATLASGATNTFTYSFTAPTTTGSVTQTSNVTTTTSEGSGTGTYANAANFTSTIGTITDVSTTITAANASVATGQTGSFSVTFSNAGPSPATSPTLQVQLPAGLSGVTITGTSAGTTGSYNATTGLVTYTYGTAGTALPSGTNIASTINFTVPATGSVTAAATIATATSELGRTSNNADKATITATPGADVAIVISGPASTVAGTMTTYSVVTTNNGPSPATTVAQTVQLPTGLTNVFVSNGGTYNSTSGVVTFPSLGTLANGGVVNSTISFVAPSSNITATANVSAATTDAVTTNNSSTATTTVATPATNNPTANVYTTITTPSGNVAPGSAVAFTVVAGNAGPNAAAAVVERVSLPTGLTGVTITDASGNAVSGASYSSTTGVVTFPSITSLASGSANTYVVTVTAPASGLVAATASIAATTNDPVVADNMATIDVTVNAPGDVATTLTGPTEVGAGQAVTYTVTTTNNGLVPAANVVQTVTIPARLASVTLSGGGTYDASTGLVTFPAITSQAAGNSVVNTIQYAAPAAATLVNVASVASASPDNVRTNNRSAVTTIVDPISDVTVAISGPSTIVQGNQIDYAIVTTNNGPSNATNVVTRVQLPPGLGAITLSNPTQSNYDNATGIVTFPTIASQLPGSAGTVTNIIRFIAPSNLSQINATATVSEAATAEESNYTNNTASIITAETAPTTIRTDLSTNITASPNPPTAGQSVKFTVTTTNANSSTGTATGVVQRVALEAGLTINSITNGGTYDPVTGVVTFPAISLTAGTTQTNTIDVVASGTTPLQVRALVTGDQSDPDLTNNTRFLNLTVTPTADVATAVSGPTTVAVGDAVTYSVLTINNGPSPAASVAQTVTIPTGLASGSVTITGGGTYDASTGVVTFPVITSEAPGSGGQVMNTISFTAPSTTYAVVGNVSTTTAEPATPGTANNTSTVNVVPGNLAPVANAVVNALQTPEGNTAGPLLISPLSATDANGASDIKSYTLTSIPDATKQGVLSLNGTALAVGSIIQAADAANLRFDPVDNFVGNAFFGYTATDNAGAVSAAPALYTIPVGVDLSSTYATYNASKGGATPYATGDVLAQLTDLNMARYSSNGLLFDATTGAQLTGTSNGLATTGTNAVLTAGTLPAGVSLDAATGRIYVSDRAKLVNNPTARSYSLTVQTTDLNGGTNTVPVTITLGAYPLPVELVQFEAQAVLNRDAQLSWTTASELNNARFVVERSLDGVSFTPVGQLAGQGSTARATSYAFTDAGIGPKVASGQPVYYRLQQVDQDGTVHYSPVRSVSFTKSAALALTLYPNPASAATGLDLSALPSTGTYQVLLLDATGRQVRQLTLGGGLVQHLELSDLATGTYQVLVSGQRPDGSVLRQVLRLIKE
ncbi:hypothetical protein HHL22_11815 [Hymenobacter sp. RP-2-7]|uniref:PA14 domain-containing protein n=1 Tax=Hymenobacter polaris TaxID=2682546 RepID=A0A7Y0FMI5_9BACT|nr:PA14 domain-containing protein [Hymenobacter polaris]NML65892.1 hypothetical protein [Hymenobacter polaris]